MIKEQSVINYKVPLDNEYGISAIIELGQLYKELYVDSWLYGGLELFVKENYLCFMEWWLPRATGEIDCFECELDTDLSVRYWYKNHGAKLEWNITHFKQNHNFGVSEEYTI